MAPDTTALHFQKGAEPDQSLKNFWPPENEYVWSSGTWCEVTLPFSLPDQSTQSTVRHDIVAELALDLDAFKSPPELEGQNVFIYVNGLRLASRFIKRRTLMLVDISAEMVRSGSVTVTIDTPDARRPSEFYGEDRRQLGIQLYSIALRRL